MRTIKDAHHHVNSVRPQFRSSPYRKIRSPLEQICWSLDNIWVLQYNQCMKPRRPWQSESAPEPTASELWTAWAANAWCLTATDCSERGLTTISQVRDWLYGIGIQPDRYIVRKGNNHGYARRPICQIEIRFGYSEDLAWCRMSGI